MDQRAKNPAAVLPLGQLAERGCVQGVVNQEVLGAGPHRIGLRQTLEPSEDHLLECREEVGQGV